MSRLRVGVVGVGHLGRIHARIYAEHPEAELVAVVDADGARAREVADETDCRACTELAELPDDIDAVSVVVPTVNHEEVAVPLLERGVPCLIEKPLAGDLKEADRILAAAERGGTHVAVGHVERFQPGVLRIRELGLRPRFIECHRLTAFSFRSIDIGVVHDLMIHDLDLVLHLVGSEVESIDASGGSIITGSEDVASVRIVFADGARANVTASRVSLTPMRRFRLFSGESYVSLDFTKNYALIVRKGPEWERGRAELQTLDPTELAAREDFITGDMLQVDELELQGERPLQAELDSFLGSVRAGVAPEVPGEDGRRALALADRIVAEIRSHAW
ncbi:MAG: Gfo/Idh/MocA family oxidoreductase [Planctomycetota bacterium]|nr:Gfo/Idh/MocA family oxidoreductase [Planctomycetota bacterium]